MTMLKKILDIVPSALASHAMGRLSDIEFPPAMQRAINKGFASVMNFNMNESVKDIESFKSLNELFTREIKPETRPIADASVISPVDGRLSFMGKLHDGTMLEAKGHTYDALTLAGLPAETSDDMDWLRHAYAFTIYLAPYNYHRIHAPVSGTVTDMSYAPGRLLPVNKLGYMMTDDLLPANERLTSFIHCPSGKKCALVKVGATCVGRISVVYDPFITNSTRRTPFVKHLDTPWDVKTGDALACFELGSTVVLFVDSQDFVPSSELQHGQAIKMGEALGHWN